MSSFLDSVVFASGKYKDLLPWVTTLTTLIALFIAAQGINTWQKQLRGTTKHQAASQLLRAMLKHRSLLLMLSNPVWKIDELDQIPEFSSNDLSDAEDSEKWLSEWMSNNREYRYHSTKSVFSYRIESLNKSRHQLEEFALELEVFGIKGIGECMRDIDNLSFYLFSSIKIEQRQLFCKAHPHNKKFDEESIKDMIKILADSGGKYYNGPETIESREEFENDLSIPMNSLETIVRKFM